MEGRVIYKREHLAYFCPVGPCQPSSPVLDSGGRAAPSGSDWGKEQAPRAGSDVSRRVFVDVALQAGDVLSLFR